MTRLTAVAALATLYFVGCIAAPTREKSASTSGAESATVNACGAGSCKGDPNCEDCIQNGQCASGPDPVWTGTACVCADNPPENCQYTFCCAAGLHWDPSACACVLHVKTCDDGGAHPDSGHGGTTDAGGADAGGVANACGVGSCNGDPNCESCLQDGQCAEGPDPVWTGTQCVCADFPAGNCGYPYCCGPGGYWDPAACEQGVPECMPNGFANACGVGSCNGDPNCQTCLNDGQCAGGPDPVWDGTQCVCPIPPPATPPQNCFYPYCCAVGAHWDTTACACVP